MQWDGREVRYQMDYIIVTNFRLFQDVAVRDTRHHLDHYMFMGCLRGDPAKELTGYLQKSCHPPIRTLRCDLASEPDNIFSQFMTQIPKPPLHERVRRAWISDKTWASIDTRVNARR